MFNTWDHHGNPINHSFDDETLDDETAQSNSKER